MAKRYSRPRTGTWHIYAGLHRDAYLALENYKSDHGLTTSGAVHHILRSFFELPPLQQLPES